jgi:hypothetical protein
MSGELIFLGSSSDNKFKTQQTNLNLSRKKRGYE